MNITYERDGQKYTTQLTPQYTKLSSYKMGVVIEPDCTIQSVTKDSPAFTVKGKNKFLKDVEQITFSADFANKTGQKVLYVTECCVFKLTKEGVELIDCYNTISLISVIFLFTIKLSCCIIIYHKMQKEDICFLQIKISINYLTKML